MATFDYTIEDGNGGTDDATVTVTIDLQTNYLAVESIHGISRGACAVVEGGDGYCWGGDNTTQLGIGSKDFIDISADNAIAIKEIPNPIFWNDVEMGTGFTCGIDDSNKAYCWGAVLYAMGLGDSDLIGDGDGRQTTPKEILGNLSWDLLTVSYNHVCGLDSIGSAYCWGINRFGALGIGTYDNSGVGDVRLNVPTPVDLSAVDSVSKWKYLDTGPSHTCGISEDGSAYCWGLGDRGELGTGNFDTFSYSRPVLPVINPQGVNSWNSIAVMGSGTCGIADDNQLYCWGSLNSNQGCGSGTPNTPCKIDNPNGVDSWISLAEGDGSHRCAIADDRKAYCWGDNYSYELGLGNINTTQNVNPVFGLDNVESISIGGGSTCAVTLDKRGYCWGYNTGYSETGPYQQLPRRINLIENISY